MRKKLFFLSLRDVTLKLPRKTRKNGTLSAYLLLGDKKQFSEPKRISLSSYVFYKSIELTKYKVNVTDKYVNLLEKSKILGDNEQKNSKEERKPITHLLTILNILSLNSEINFDRREVPQELIQDIR